MPLLACPDIEKVVEAFLEENYGPADERPALMTRQIRLSGKAIALEVKSTQTNEDGKTEETVQTAFFGGRTTCGMKNLSSGTIADSVKVPGAEYIFLKHTDRADGEEHAEYTVIAVPENGEIAVATDQNGGAIVFSETRQDRCEGKVGETVAWQRTAAAEPEILVRERRTVRDKSCRLTEDSSSYRYYRLTATNWVIEEDE